jgi:sulfonate transport system substrate-binding protein
MAPEVAKTAFEAGGIDAWAVWPPFVEQQLKKGNGKILQGGDAVIQSVVAMPSIMLTDYPKISNEIIAIVNKAKTWIEENPQEAISIVAKELDLDVEVVELAWNKHSWSAKLDKRLIDDIQEKAKFLAKEKMTRNNAVVEVKDLIFEYDKKYK